LQCPMFGFLTLALFVFRVSAYHHHSTATADDATFFANFFDGCSNFHLSSCLENPAILDNRRSVTARIAVGGKAGQGVGLSSIKLYKVRVFS
jgi:hypothetical protein